MRQEKAQLILLQQKVTQQAKEATQQAEEATQREQTISVERDAAIAEKKEKEAALTQAATEIERLKSLLDQQS